MNKEELIEVLRQFDEKRVEELPEKTRNIFYAIMKIADERDRLNNIINELEEYIKPYLYMLNGIQDRDIYEQCQLDDFTDIMEKLQELKGNNK